MAAAAAGQRRGGPISRMLRRMQNRSDPIPRCLVREFCVISGSDGHGRFSKQYGIPVQIARNSSLLRVNSRLLMQSSGIGQLQPESALDGGLGTGVWGRLLCCASRVCTRRARRARGARGSTSRANHGTSCTPIRSYGTLASWKQQ